MKKSRWTRFSLNPYTTHHVFGIGIGAAVGIAGTAVSAGTSIAGAVGGSDAAGQAAGLQKEYIDLGINELRGALDPSMERMQAATDWSERLLGRQFDKSMGETAPYYEAGRQGLNRLSYRMGLDTGAGAQPKAPKMPKAPKALKPPKYDKDPKKAAAQKATYDKAVLAQRNAFEKAQRIYGRQQTQFDADTAAFNAKNASAGTDPEYGGLLDDYDDKFDSQIDDVAKRTYDDKYAPEILATSRDTFDAADFEADPGYEFRRSEGDRGIEQKAAAGGGLQSGATQKALIRFNQDTASNEFDRSHGRWVDQHNRHLVGVTGQQAFDKGTFDTQKAGELAALENRRNFDFGSWKDDRDFEYGALMGQVGIGQDATNDRNQARQFYGTSRAQNQYQNALHQGQWQQDNAKAIAEFLTQSGNAQAAGVVGAQQAQNTALQGFGNSLSTLAGYYYGNKRQPGTVVRSPAVY